VSATREQIEAGLQALIEAGGNSRKAAEETGTPERTLRLWRVENPDAYRRMETIYFDELEEATRSRAQETAHHASDLESRLLKHVEDRIDRMDGKDAANAARAVADVKKKAIDTWTALQDRNPDGNGPKEDGWEMIKGGVRAGVLKLTPEVQALLGEDQE
jgi:hypothetical protein